ncbi:hypothetical protein Tco_0833213 [Tanacetum coccineum]
MFSIIYEPVHGIIYKNSKKEKRVMRHSEIHKFCDATLKSYNNDVKYGYKQRDLTIDEVEYLKLFEEEIEVRLKYRNQMRRWEMFYGANLKKAQKTMQFWSKNDKVYIMLERKDMTYSPLVIRRIKLLQYASLVAITSQLRSLGREMKNLSEQVHFVHVSYEHSNGSHLSKDYPNKEKVKEVEEIYYGEFYQRPYPYSGRMSRHLEDLLKNKSRIDDEEKEKMNEYCFAWLENTLPSKEKDLGSFTLHCVIGQYSFSNALADLGASV